MRSAEQQMTMESHVDLYLDYLTVERGLAANTRASYSADLLKFLTYLKERGIGDWSEIGYSEVMVSFHGLKNRVWRLEAGQDYFRHSVAFLNLWCETATSGKIRWQT